MNSKDTKKCSGSKPGQNKKFVPWGRTLTTNDHYLGKQKTSSRKERPVVVIDTKQNNLAVVPLSSRSGSNRTRLPEYQNGKSFYKHFIEIEDNEGKPIRVNNKFRENHKNMDVSKQDVDSIRRKVFSESRHRGRNNSLMEKFRKK